MTGVRPLLPHSVREPLARLRGATFVALLAGLIAACSVTREGASEHGSLPVTIADPAPRSDPELAIGAREHPRIIAGYGGVYSDPQVETAIAAVVGKLVEASEDPGRRYRVTILNSPSVNAFALPGGFIYVTRGLLALANDYSEVAAVIAHEIAHVTLHHGIERENRARAAAIASRTIKAVGDPSAAGLALVANQLSLASFSRRQELEADRAGIATAARAGFDPYAASRFLTSMDRFARLRTGDEGPPDFLSSHPSTPQRVQLAIEAARQFGSPGLGRSGHDEYLKAIDGLLYGDDPSEGYTQGRHFMHPRLGIGFDADPDFTLENSNSAVLGTAPDGSAMRFDAVDVPPSRDLVEYLTSGWIGGLDPLTVHAFEINGLPAAEGVAHADGWVFRITLVRVDEATYRFIFAARSDSTEFKARADGTTATFRRLSKAEIANLQPLRIRSVTVRADDTPQGIAARMTALGDRALQTFLVLNGLSRGDRLTPGTRVKVVAN